MKDDPGNKVDNWIGGWLNGEWKCPLCQTMIGKNLRGESPFALVHQHQTKCKSDPNNNEEGDVR